MFSISTILLSIQLIISYSNKFIILTGVVSFITSFFIWKKTIKENYKTIKENKFFSIICTICLIFIWINFYISKKNEGGDIFNNFIINPMRIRYFILSTFSVIYLGVYITNKVKCWIVSFYKSLDTWEKRAYIIASVISTITIIIAYFVSSKWYKQDDIIYSMDTSRNIQRFVTPTYYDIRHALIDLITFPVYTIINIIVNISIPNKEIGSILKVISYQLLNSQLMILIGLQIKKLTNNKKVFILYMLSFSTILYTLFFEKFQICTFLLVLYVFTICNKKEKSTASIVAAVGTMTTSCVIGIAELLTDDKFINKIKKILKIVFVSSITFICLGRAHIIKYGMKEIQDKRNAFTNKNYTVQEKLVATVNSIKGTLYFLPSESTENGKYMWKGLQEKASILGISIMIIAIIGIIKNRKELFVKISAAWFIFEFVLFVILNWATQETPLFALYFSWAIIPLFVMGVDFILEKIKIEPKIIYSLLIISMLIINIQGVIDIYNFLPYV